jgi:hypothetical protein
MEFQHYEVDALATELYILTGAAKSHIITEQLMWKRSHLY